MIFNVKTDVVCWSSVGAEGGAKKRASEASRDARARWRGMEKDGHVLRAPALLKTTFYREFLTLDHPNTKIVARVTDLHMNSLSLAGRRQTPTGPTFNFDTVTAMEEDGMGWDGAPCLGKVQSSQARNFVIGHCEKLVVV
jgi:hypothetical protein